MPLENYISTTKISLDALIYFSDLLFYKLCNTRGCLKKDESDELGQQILGISLAQSLILEYVVKIRKEFYDEYVLGIKHDSNDEDYDDEES